MKKILFILLVCFQVANSNILLAQVNDAGLWMTVSVEKKISKKFKVVVAEEMRLRENISMIGQLFTDVSLQYKVTKNFLISGSYRFSMKQNLDFMYEPRQRIYGDLVYKNKANKFDFYIRTRVQEQDRYIVGVSENNLQTWYWRNKVAAKYDAKDFTPFISFEAYYSLNNPKGNVIDGLRYQAGTDYKLNKHNSFTLYYLIDQEIQVNNPQNSYVVGVEYNYTF
jgi:hypothetical protein